MTMQEVHPIPTAPNNGSPSGGHPRPPPTGRCPTPAPGSTTCVRDNGHHALLAGPFENDHPAALAIVRPGRERRRRVNARAPSTPSGPAGPPPTRAPGSSTTATAGPHSPPARRHRPDPGRDPPPADADPVADPPPESPAPPSWNPRPGRHRRRPAWPALAAVLVPDARPARGARPRHHGRAARRRPPPPRRPAPDQPGRDAPSTPGRSPPGRSPHDQAPLRQPRRGRAAASHPRRRPPLSGSAARAENASTAVHDSGGEIMAPAGPRPRPRRRPRVRDPWQVDAVGCSGSASTQPPGPWPTTGAATGRPRPPQGPR